MLSKKELLESPNYLLSSYQLEIYSQIAHYRDENKLTQKQLAAKLNVSNAYVSQVLNGNFNFTLKKLIELGLVIGKIPYLEFISENEFWRRKKYGTKEYVVESATYSVVVESSTNENDFLKVPSNAIIAGGVLPNWADVKQEVTLKSEW